MAAGKKQAKDFIDRQLMNQANFEKFCLHPDRIGEASFRRPFDELPEARNAAAPVR